MACARVRAIMHSLTLVHYRYVHAHNHAITKIYYITDANIWMDMSHSTKVEEFLSLKQILLLLLSFSSTLSLVVCFH